MLFACGINKFSHDVAHSITGVKAEIEDCSVTIGRIPDKPFNFFNHVPFYYRYKGRD